MLYIMKAKEFGYLMVTTENNFTGFQHSNDDCAERIILPICNKILFGHSQPFLIIKSFSSALSPIFNLLHKCVLHSFAWKYRFLLFQSAM